ncbi:MAG: sulfite exporter TauE/SafE family protein, partial [Candidatus Eremiobacteraeota bacterium]|nr:sulfite exporter TauE/SafE family protein [Candidatus Eremiobacteraeota bacterium]
MTSASVLHVATLVALGALAGVLGTIVGLGGGFVVLPVLRIFYGIAPAATAGISLVMVMANAVSGSFAYVRQRRADVRVAVFIAITGIPASVLGAYLVGQVSFAGFDLLYGALLIYFFIDIVRRRNKKPATFTVAGLRERRLVDAYGEEFRYLTSAPLILLCGLALGFISSFFGIGGGIIFVMVFIATFR